MQQPAEYLLILAAPMIALIFLLIWAFGAVRGKREVSLRIGFMGLTMEVRGSSTSDAVKTPSPR